MLTITTCLWDANDHSKPFSRCYTEEWANKLFRGFQRNLTKPFRFVVFTDREREFTPGIEQERLTMMEPHYGACIEPLSLDEPQIFCGLDTVIVGNVDHVADYVMGKNKPAVPNDPFYPEQATNAVVLSPKGSFLAEGYRGQNDMDWIRKQDCARTDKLFPRQIASYKGRVQWMGVEPETRVVFFHGVRKPHELDRIDFIKEHWV